MLSIASHTLRTALRPARRESLQPVRRLPNPGPGPEYGYGSDYASAQADYANRRLAWCENEIDGKSKSISTYKIMLATSAIALGILGYKLYKMRVEEKSTTPALSLVK